MKTTRMTREEVAQTLGCGMQRSWVWTSSGSPAALVLHERKNPALPERVCVGDSAGTRERAHRVDGLTLPVYSHDGKGAYRFHGDRALLLDAGEEGKARAGVDSPSRLEREGSLYGVLHLRAPAG